MMQACPEREADLQALLFGELPEERQAGLEGHLAGCAGCREALRLARRALAALEDLQARPQPYRAPGPPTGDEGDGAWRELVRRMRREGVRDILDSAGEDDIGPGRSMWGRPWAAAAAALLLVGLGLAAGRWLLPSRAPRVDLTAQGFRQAADLGVDEEAMDALIRAEFLADAGIEYVSGLQRLARQMADARPDQADEALLAAFRARAEELLREGRLLRRGLDPDRDAGFLAAIGRAELFLEEAAVLGKGPAGSADLTVLQAALSRSRLRETLEEVDLEQAVAVAYEASRTSGEEREGMER